MSQDSQSQYAARLEEFLAYFAENEQALRDVMKFEGVKGLALQVWKDSRSAVVVELPFLYPGPRQHVVEAIEAAGVQVAP